MPARVDKLAHGLCGSCRRPFTYAAKLPRQDICWECYYENAGDLTGAREEHVWQLGYRQGQARGDAATRAETLAKIRELLPFRELFLLCHPDKHPPERHPEANRATALLIDLRAALEEPS